MSPDTAFRTRETLTPDEAKTLCRDAMTIWKDATGRGATYSSAHGSPGSTTVIFRDVLTQSERTLVGYGQADSVRQGRREILNAVRAEMIEAVEKSAATPVETVLYDIDPVHDTCAFTFVFAKPLNKAERGG